MSYAAFDIGNIILHVDLDKHITDISNIFKITQEDALEFLKNIQVKQDLGVNDYQSCAHHYFGSRDYKFDRTTFQQAYKSWLDCVQLCQPMIDMIASLIEKGIQVSFLSNMGFDHKNHIYELLLQTDSGRIVKEKSYFYFSCDLNVRKPSLVFYNTFTQVFNEYKGCIYIDDIMDNLKAAKLCGFDPIYFNLDEIQDIETSVQDLEIHIIRKTRGLL